MASRFAIDRTARLIRAGGVVAYPTEGVFGLGCRPDDPEAVARILQIKGRKASAGLILLAAGLEQLLPWIQPSASELERLQQRCDYPTTWIVTARHDTPVWLTGGRRTLAVRITDHPTAAALCRAAGTALVSTSANRSGKTPARSSLAARLHLGLQVDSVLCAPLGSARGPSAIRDARDNRVLRPGA